MVVHPRAKLMHQKWQRKHGGEDFRLNSDHHTAAEIFATISAITRRRRFRQIFGHHTAAQISSKFSTSTRWRRCSSKFRPSHGGAEFRFHFVSFSFCFLFVFVFVFVFVSFSFSFHFRFRFRFCFRFDAFSFARGGNIQPRPTQPEEHNASHKCPPLHNEIHACLWLIWL